MPIATSGVIWPFNETDVWLIVLTSAAFSYVGLLAIGLPLTIALRRQGRLTLGWLTFTGAISGVFVILIFGWLLGLALGSSASANFIQIAWGAILGSAVALSYGLISGKDVLAQVNNAA